MAPITATEPLRGIVKRARDTRHTDGTLVSERLQALLGAMRRQVARMEARNDALRVEIAQVRSERRKMAHAAREKVLCEEVACLALEREAR